MAITRKPKVSWPSLVRWLQSQNLEPAEVKAIVKNNDRWFNEMEELYKDLYQFYLEQDQP